MSSTEYSAEFQPDPSLRRLIAWSGIVLSLAGIVIILFLPLDLRVRFLACAFWGASAAGEHRLLHRGWATCHALRFSAGGDVSILDGDGQWRPACREAGSVLLSKVGWIRFRDDRGTVHGELLSGNARQSPDWRRLQVIWRHVGAGG